MLAATSRQTSGRESRHIRGRGGFRERVRGFAGGRFLNTRPLTIHWTTARKPARLLPHSRTAMVMNRIHAGKSCHAWRRVGRSRGLPIEEWQQPTVSTPRNARKAQAPFGRCENQAWHHDVTVNWLSFQSEALNQTRQFNGVNEPRHLWRGAETAASQTRPQGGVGRPRRRRQITSINGPSGVVTPQYDPVGNMTSMPAVSNWTTAQTLKWDAWNRLVRVTEGSTTIAEYSYDALFRRVTKTVSGTTRRFYYSDQWQILEEYLGSAVNPEMRYWYGLRDINDIARRQFLGGTNTDLYALRETMNVVALVGQVSGTWKVTQRMAYDAFGNARCLNASSWANDANNAIWPMLFHGHYMDGESGLYQIRFRYYRPTLGVWPSRDPILEAGGNNLYAFVHDAPLNRFDLYGLQTSLQTPAGAAAVVEAAAMEAGFSSAAAYAAHLARLAALAVRAAEMAKLVSGMTVAAVAALIAECSGIYASYKAIEKLCRSCPECRPKGPQDMRNSIRLVNCACWAMVVRLRSEYIDKLCDFVLPGSASDPVGKEENHKGERDGKIRSMVRCCNLCFDRQPPQRTACICKSESMHCS